MTRAIESILLGVLLGVLVLACGGDDDGMIPPDGSPPSGTFDCGTTFCRVDTEACVYPNLAPARCEPRVDPMGGDLCRAHVDAYCGGAGDRCVEGPDGALPAGGYNVFCL